MHILLALVAALGTLGIILWRLHMAAEAAKGLAETANEARGLIRGWRWRRKLAKNPLDLVQDPREAAAALMVAMAHSDGVLTERERQVILAEAVCRFEATERQAQELLAHARWLTRDVRDVDQCIARLAPLIRRTCDPDQICDVIEMVSKVAAAEGAPGAVEQQALDGLKRALAS